MRITRVELEMYKLIKINEFNLPKYWPANYIKDCGSRYFMEELDLINLELQMLSGELDDDMLGDLHGLNSYVISKMGKLRSAVIRDDKLVGRFEMILKLIEVNELNEVNEDE